MKDFFLPKGALLLDQKIQQQRKLKFICSCGNEGEIWLGNLLHDKNKTILCEDCLGRLRQDSLNRMNLSSFKEKVTRLPQDEKFLIIASRFWNVQDKGFAMHHILPWSYHIKLRTSFTNVYPLRQEIHGGPRQRGEYYTDLHYPITSPKILPEDYPKDWLLYNQSKGISLFNFVVTEIIFPLSQEDLRMQGRTTAYSQYELLNVKEEFFKNNILYIPIFYAELKERQQIIFSIIKQKLRHFIPNIYSYTGTEFHRYFARSLILKQISSQEAFSFYERNHVQGGLFSQINLALYHGNEIIQCLSFSKSRFGSHEEYELTRSATKLNSEVVGGIKKLFSFFIKTFSPKEIISFCDRRYSSFLPEETVYSRLNFEFIESTRPSYYYVDKDSNVFLTRQQCTKQKLLKLYGGDSLKTEEQIASENGLIKQYDCGSFKFIWRNNI